MTDKQEGQGIAVCTVLTCKRLWYLEAIQEKKRQPCCLTEFRHAKNTRLIQVGRKLRKSTLINNWLLSLQAQTKCRKTMVGNNESRFIHGSISVPCPHAGRNTWLSMLTSPCMRKGWVTTMLRAKLSLGDLPTVQKHRSCPGRYWAWD